MSIERIGLSNPGLEALYQKKTSEGKSERECYFEVLVEYMKCFVNEKTYTFHEKSRSELNSLHAEISQIRNGLDKYKIQPLCISDENLYKLLGNIFEAISHGKMKDPKDSSFFRMQVQGINSPFPLVDVTNEIQCEDPVTPFKPRPEFTFETSESPIRSAWITNADGVFEEVYY